MAETTPWICRACHATYTRRDDLEAHFWNEHLATLAAYVRRVTSKRPPPAAQMSFNQPTLPLDLEGAS